MIPYYGGKTWLKKHILAMAMKTEGVYGFLDVFVGGGSVSDSLVEVYDHGMINDIDSNLTNFYGVVKGNSEELLDFLNKRRSGLTLDLIKGFKKNVFDSDQFCCVERAFMYYVMARTSYSGKTYACPTKWKLDKFMGLNVEKDLSKIKETLDKVDISNKDYRELSCSGNFCYCDPPYFKVYEPYYGLCGRNHKGFVHEEFHEWAEQMSRSNKVVISYDNSDEVRTMYKDWNLSVVDKKTTHILKGENVSSQANELLISNF